MYNVNVYHLCICVPVETAIVLGSFQSYHLLPLGGVLLQDFKLAFNHIEHIGESRSKTIGLILKKIGSCLISNVDNCSFYTCLFVNHILYYSTIFDYVAGWLWRKKWSCSVRSQRKKKRQPRHLGISHLHVQMLLFADDSASFSPPGSILRFVETHYKDTLAYTQIHKSTCTYIYS